MDIQVKRVEFSEKSTISDCYVNGEWVCYILEDKDRQRQENGSVVVWNKDLKVPKETAIPRGRYEVIVSFSNRFNKYLPLLLAVPAYEGVRIHPGNTDADTEGCLLPGTWKGKDQVSESRKAFKKLFALIQKAEKKEKIYLNIC